MTLILIYTGNYAWIKMVQGLVSLVYICGLKSPLSNILESKSIHPYHNRSLMNLLMNIRNIHPPVSVLQFQHGEIDPKTLPIEFQVTLILKRAVCGTLYKCD